LSTPRHHADRRVPPYPVVCANADDLHRVLGNLFDNAVQHGRGPKTITARDQESDLVIEIRDHGLQVFYGTLCKRIPTLALAADTDSLEFKDDYLAYGVRELPVTW
jgi:light-regulated signal transduction histidine kinase (bacteriophytochrome)